MRYPFQFHSAEIGRHSVFVDGEAISHAGLTPDSRKKTLKRRRAAICLFAAVLLLAGCSKKADTKEGGAAAEAEPATPVTVEPAVRGAIDHMVIADAVLYPINQANVTAKIAAPVKRILVNRGDHVRAGQVIAELESADLVSAAE